MARPVEFNRDLASDRALRLFWSRGYQGAGLTDLLAAMEIGRSSFYAAFGDKRRLFLECLDQFAARSVAMLRPREGRRSPLQILRGFFEQDAFAPDSEERAWGCMLVNTVVEMSDLDEGLRAHASQGLENVQAAFESLLLDAGCDPAEARDYAGFLMLVNEGLRVSSRQGMPIVQQRKQVSVAFDMLTSNLTRKPPIEA